MNVRHHTLKLRRVLLLEKSIHACRHTLPTEPAPHTQLATYHVRVPGKVLVGLIEQTSQNLGLCTRFVWGDDDVPNYFVVGLCDDRRGDVVQFGQSFDRVLGTHEANRECIFFRDVRAKIGDLKSFDLRELLKVSDALDDDQWIITLVCNCCVKGTGQKAKTSQVLAIFTKAKK